MVLAPASNSRPWRSPVAADGPAGTHRPGTDRQPGPGTPRRGPRSRRPPRRTRPTRPPSRPPLRSAEPERDLVVREDADAEEFQRLSNVVDCSNFFSSHNCRNPSKYSGVAMFTPPSPWMPSIMIAAVAGEIAARIAARSLNGTWPEPGHRRLKSLFHLLLPGRCDPRHRPAVKGIQRGDDLVTPLIMAKLPRQLEQPLVRLRAAVAEETFARSDQIHQRLRQPALRRLVIQI